MQPFDYTENLNARLAAMFTAMRTRWDAIVTGEVELPANDELGFTIEDAPDPKSAIVLSWTVPPELCNSAGNLQGGVLAAFADAVLGAATSVYLPDDQYPALAEMKISIVRPARSGMGLLGTGRIVKPGRRVLFAEAEVTGPDGELIAKASGTEIPADI